MCPGNVIILKKLQTDWHHAFVLFNSFIKTVGQLQQLEGTLAACIIKLLTTIITYNNVKNCKSEEIIGSPKETPLGCCYPLLSNIKLGKQQSHKVTTMN